MANRVKIASNRVNDDAKVIRISKEAYALLDNIKERRKLTYLIQAFDEAVTIATHILDNDPKTYKNALPG